MGYVKGKGAAEAVGFDSRLTAQSGAALMVHWTIIHYCPFDSHFFSNETNKHPAKGCLFVLAEAVGFEPTDPAKGLPDFESGPL